MLMVTPQIQEPVPVHLISGFLGSGKTTLLTKLIDYYRSLDKRAAVIMNELGEVNLDGQLLEGPVPMSEMLSGCICCTIRGDLSLEIKTLIDEHRPDIILIESTGAANPLEIIDGVTETAMVSHIDLQSVTTVVDGPALLEMSRKGRGLTFRLMREQVRCATHLVVNKADRLAPEEIIEAEQLVREWNTNAPMTVTVKSVIDMERFTRVDSAAGPYRLPRPTLHREGSGHSHESHEHVMVLTHYLTGPVDSRTFEEMLNNLPDEVYRAKGIVTFKDTASKFLFQYAYRETEFIRITPQGEVNDVAVFIGEFFSKEQLLAGLRELENK